MIANASEFILLQRMPRDFRWQADQFQPRASELRSQGKLAEAISKYREALQIYPHFLSALIFRFLSQKCNGTGGPLDA